MLLRHSVSPNSGRRADERGETLIELIVAVVLIGVGVVALLGSLFSVIVLTNRHRNDVAVANAATGIAERIQAEVYVPCANADTVAYKRWLTTNPESQFLSFDYLVDQNSATPSFTGACPGTDQGVQRIRLQTAKLYGSDRRVTTITIYKRNDSCPVSYAPVTVGGQRC